MWSTRMVQTVKVNYTVFMGVKGNVPLRTADVFSDQQWSARVLDTQTINHCCFLVFLLGFLTARKM